MNILVVEDDIYIGNLLEELLKSKYNVIRAFSGSEAILQFNQSTIDLVLLDLMLPGLTGEQVLKELKGKTKIIVLSAKAGIEDKVQNLINGANDFISKPFNNSELLARIEVQLRIKEDIGNTLVINEIKVDINNVKVFVNDNELKLTRLEFGILVFLMKNSNRIYSRNQIFESVWNYDSLGNEDSVKVHISNLKKKIAQFSDKKYIDTVWGIGFKFFSE